MTTPTGTRHSGLSRDATLLIGSQGIRAVGYGFTAVILGALLAQRGYSHLRAGVVLAALIAGTALASLVVGAVADRVGRRRCYAAFYLLVAVAGAVVAAGAPFWVLLIVALTGTLSTDVVDNGPATTLEQVMLAAEDAGTSAVYGRYNAVGAAAGALGALAAALPGLDHGVHAYLFELVCEPSAGGETVVVTVWPSHDVFDAWIATPHRDALTGSDVHQAVDYRPITRYDVPGGYLNLLGLTAHDPNPPRKDMP